MFLSDLTSDMGDYSDFTSFPASRFWYPSQIQNLSVEGALILRR